MKHKKIFRRSAVLYNALYIKPLMMHTPIRSLPLRADYDLTTVYGSALHYFAKSVVGEKKNARKSRQTNAKLGNIGHIRTGEIYD